MIRMLFCLHRLPSLSLDEFQTYWLETHSPLDARHAPTIGLALYRQHHHMGDPVLGALLKGRLADQPFDGVAELGWNSEADLLGGGSRVALEQQSRGLEGEHDPGQRRTEPVVQVAADPAPFLLPGGDELVSAALQLLGELGGPHGGDALADQVADQPLVAGREPGPDPAGGQADGPHLLVPLVHGEGPHLGRAGADGGAPGAAADPLDLEADVRHAQRTGDRPGDLAEAVLDPIDAVEPLGETGHDVVRRVAAPAGQPPREGPGA